MDEVTECETEAVAECGGIDARYPIGDRDRCKTVTAVNTLAMPRPPFREIWCRTVDTNHTPTGAMRFSKPPPNLSASSCI